MIWDVFLSLASFHSKYKNDLGFKPNYNTYHSYAKRVARYRLFWTRDELANCFCSLWLVKVCQWVTLTPVQGCREGGADELGHMVAHCSLLETVTAKPVLQTTGVAPSSQLFPVRSLNGLWRISRCISVTLNLVEVFFSRLTRRIYHHLRGRKTAFFASLKTSSENLMLRFDMRFFFFPCICIFACHWHPTVAHWVCTVINVNVVAWQSVSRTAAISDFPVAEH